MVFVLEGLQWGDDGNGKITDYLASHMDIVCRHQGGNNAGHSLVVNGVRYALKSLPSGIINPKIINVIANGCVVNLFSLIEEINTLKEKGITNFNLYISSRAHIIMPYHLDLDGAYEELLKNGKIGTTKKGIGPCYSDRASRLGIRVGDILEPEYLKKRLEEILPIKNLTLRMVNKKEYDLEELYNKLISLKPILEEHIIDTSVFLRKAIKEGKNILFEGAQGAMLCLDNGTYPYVTSSSPLANSVSINASIPPQSISKVVGIMKAYTTRVGEGPFVTELNNEIGDNIREIGHEYGTVTKRPRRVGYLDLVVVKNAIEISGTNYLSLMLLDVLTNISPLKICTHYELDGRIIDYIPSTISELNRCKPVYKEMKPWKEDISKIKDYASLPNETKEYISFIEEYCNCKVAFISVGPDRDATIIKEDIFND